MNEKIKIKKHTNGVAKGILIYQLIMMAVSILVPLIKVIQVALHYAKDAELDQKVNAVLEQSMNSGMGMIISLTLGLLLLFFYFRKQEFSKKLFNKNKSMKISSFCFNFVLFMSAQAIFMVISAGSESILNLFGYSIMAEIESATGQSTMLSMFLYVSFLGPIAEEVIFRGFVMRAFEGFGKTTAIVCSAILFGAFHGNLIQGIFAAAVGLVLGYVAMEYSIYWSIIVHIINNFVFGDLWSYAVGRLNETLQQILFGVFHGSFFLGAVILIFLKRKEIKNYWEQNRGEKGIYKIIFTSFWLLLFMTLQLGIGLMGIHKI